MTGPFCVEATIPTPLTGRGQGRGRLRRPRYGSFVDRMLEVLRKSPVLRLEGNKTVRFANVRPPAKTLSLSAEAVVANGAEKPVAFVFGPENGAVSEKLVYEAAREAHAKSYSHLYVIGFAIQPNARMLIEKSAKVRRHSRNLRAGDARPDDGRPAKNMRSSQIFSVCGLPEVEVRSRDRKTAAEAVSGRIARARRVRPDHDGEPPSQRQRRAGVVPGHRLQRPVLPRQPSLLPAHGRMGKSEEGARGEYEDKRVGSSGRNEPAHRSRRVTTARSRSR